MTGANTNVAFTGDAKKSDSGFVQLDFTNFNKPGYYTIKIGNHETKPFAIGDEVYLATSWHALNFFYAERCGYEQPGIRQECHKDVMCVHPDGRKLSVAGGWHDAADLTQGVGNTARGGIAMLELAKSVKNKNEQLYKLFLER